MKILFGIFFLTSGLELQHNVLRVWKFVIVSNEVNSNE